MTGEILDFGTKRWLCACFSFSNICLYIILCITGMFSTRNNNNENNSNENYCNFNKNLKISQIWLVIFSSSTFNSKNLNLHFPYSSRNRNCSKSHISFCKSYIIFEHCMRPIPILAQFWFFCSILLNEFNFTLELNIQRNVILSHTITMSLLIFNVCKQNQKIL